MKILVGLSYTIGLGYGAILVFENKIALGDLVTFNVYLGMLIWPMFAIGELINLLQRGNASIDRVYEVLEYKERAADDSQIVEVSTVSSIDFKDVTFRYPSATTNQLDHFSLHIKKGQTIGIVGKTGRGKTTLFQLLLRAYPKMVGEIHIYNAPFAQIALAQMSTSMRDVPQYHFLFSKSTLAKL